MKDYVLGKSYVLSLVFCDDILSKKLNGVYKGKNRPTNILSFPLDKKEGEIFLNIKQARREAKTFGRNTANFIGFLFIHGLVHLKGFTHSSRMEAQEIIVRKKFGI